MTISSTTNRVSYAGNSSTTVFSFPYYFLADADLVVIDVLDSDGTETVKTLTTHYTVSGEGEPAGGSVTMLAAPATGHTLVIYRDVAIVQPLDLVANDPSPAESTEEAFDRLTMISQRLDERADRSLTLPEGLVGAFDAQLPAALDANPGATIIVNATGDGFDIGPTATEISDAATEAAAAAASAVAAAASAVAADASADAAALSEAAALLYSTSVTALSSYVDDAAYVSANGAAQDGDIYYNSTADKARLYANGAWGYIGGGGGGSSLDWIEDADAPVASFEYSQRVYGFEDALTQNLYSAVRVPSTYTAGGQINLRGVFYANGTSNTVLFSTVATLIRTGTDAVTSTTNQRTSTNSAVTLAVTANRPNSFVCDLTSSTGTINSVAVSAGDVILVKLFRDTATDTSTATAMFPPYSTEVTFS